MRMNPEDIDNAYRKTMRRTWPLMWLRWHIFGHMSERMLDRFQVALNANYPIARHRSRQTCAEFMRNAKSKNR